MNSGILRAALPLLVVALLLATAYPAAADAQITVQQVLGKSVSDPGTNYPDVQEAINRFLHSDAPATRLYLEKARKKDPQLPPIEIMMAALWHLANQVNNERAELENCVKNWPDDPEAYLLLGDFSYTEGRIAAAEALFNRGAELTTAFHGNARRRLDFQIRIQAGLAAIAEWRGQWDLARKCLEAWTTLDSSSSMAHVRLGRALFFADSAADKAAGARQAYEQFQIAQKADPKSVSPDLAVGLLMEDAKQHERAQKFITHAMADLPTDPAARMSTIFSAARWALDSDQPQQAFDFAEAALKLDPKSQDAKYLKALAARLLGDVKTAEQCLQEINLAAPENFAASNQLAQVLAEQDDKEKRERALQLATMNQRMHAQDQQNSAQAVESAATLGWVLLLMKRSSEATQALQSVANAGSPSADNLYFMARLLDDRGDAAGAARLTSAALQAGHSFIHRKEAQQLQAKLAKAHGASAAPETSPASPAPPAPAKSVSPR